MSRAGHTILEACLALGLILCTLIGALVGGARWGLAGVLPGMLVGLLVVAAPSGLLLVLELVRERRNPPPPWWPPCFRGPCGREVDFRRAPEEDLPEGLPCYRCACGDLYARSPERIVRVIAPGFELPYVVRDERGRWVPAR